MLESLWKKGDQAEYIRDLKDDLDHMRRNYSVLQKEAAKYEKNSREDSERANFYASRIRQLVYIVCPDRQQQRRNQPELYQEIDHLLDQGYFGKLADIVIEQTKRLNNEITKLQSENQQTIEDARAQLRDANALRERELMSLRKEKNDMERRLKRELEEEETRYLGYLANQKTEHDRIVKQLEEDGILAEQRYTADLARVEQERLLQEETSKRRLESTVAQMNADHKEATQRYKRDLEAYSEALVKRDKFTGLLRDEDIKAKFIDLVKLVEDVADLDWRDDRVVWPDHLLRGLAENQRLLKKHLLQDTLWIILHDYIFCSPFRVFGAEGEKLENLWIECPGKDSRLDSFDNGIYAWPPPDPETERWRYVNIEECRKALSQTISSEWDTRLRLKTDFASWSRKMNQELTSILSEMIYWDDNVAQKVKKMTKRMSNVWLEFGLQRCRILIVLKGSRMKSPIDKLNRLHEGSLELGIAPELVRCGNSKGWELESRATIKGCQGQMVTVPSR